MSNIIAPRQVRFYPPTSLRFLDILTEPTIEGATAESYRDDDIADGGLALNLIDAKVRRFVTAFDNLVANPQFKTDTDWTKESGWTINPGKPGFALYDGDSDEGIFQNGVVTSSQTYVIIVKCTELSIGGFTPMLGTAEDGDITQVGISVHTITANGTGFRLEADGETVGKIEYIYVLDSNDYRFDLMLNSRRLMNFAIVDGQNLLDVFPTSLLRSIKLYHHSSDVFGSASEITPISVITGLLGRSRPLQKYDGLTARTSTADDESLDFGAGDGSIEFDIIINDLSSDQGIFERTSGGTDYLRCLYDQSGQLINLDQRSSDGGRMNSSTTYDFVKGQRYHIVWTMINGISMTWYVDGVEAPIIVHSNVGGVFNSETGLDMGRSNTVYGEIELFKLAYYNRALAPKEIEQMPLDYPVPNPHIIGSNSSLDTHNNWLNNDLNSFDNSGDLTLVSTSINQFCYLTLVSIIGGIPTGTNFRLSYDATIRSGGFKFQTAGANQVITTASESGTNITVDFVASGIVTGLGILLVAITGSSDADFDNIYLIDLDTLVSFPLVVDQWGNQTNLNLAACVNSDYDTFANGTITGFDAIYSTAGTQNAGTTDAITFTEDEIYIVYFFLILNSGALPIVDLKSGLGSGSITGTPLTAVEGVNQMMFTPNTTLVGVVDFQNVGATNYEITGFIVRNNNALGADAAYQPGGISKEQDAWLDSGVNKLNGVNVDVEYIDAPDSNNLGFFLMRFDDVLQSLYWFLSINEDNDLPIDLQKYGQWILGKEYLFDITALEEFAGSIDYPGVDVIETDSGVFDVTKRYGNRDRFIIPLAGQNRDTFNEYQEMLAVIGGMELPFYMEVLPLDDEDESVVYRLRLAKKESPFSYLFGSGEPWLSGLEVVVDL